MTLATPGMRAVADTLLLFIYSFNIYLIFIIFFGGVCVWSFDKDTRDKGPHIGWLNWNMTHIQTLDSVNMADFTIGCLSAQSRCSNKKTFVFQFDEHHINFWTNRNLRRSLVIKFCLFYNHQSVILTIRVNTYISEWRKDSYSRIIMNKHMFIFVDIK